MARGDEILVVDGSSADRDGLKEHFESQGYVVTVVEDTHAARELLLVKFFPAVLVDIDVEPDSALDLIRLVRERSSQSGVILLTSRRAFDISLAAFRLGVIDVIPKRPADVPYLEQRVAVAADRYRIGGREETNILREARDVLQEALGRLLDLARKVPSTASALDEASRIRLCALVVDDQTSTFDALRAALPDELDLHTAHAGGMALDIANARRFDLVAVKHDLPDLPGPMVVRSIQASDPEVAGLVYRAAQYDAHINVFEQGRSKELLPLHTTADLAQAIGALHEHVLTTRRQRRFLQSFRNQEAHFLRRYAELRRKLDRLLG